ncbi:MAG: IscS subfamily cysteine desulfurase [Legionellales bacterium RIFCSPHIGHO2_12_FULL_42_9]|nr:MAG: IscS subfamily cysteine desulfurase [Legionellales bacterium RIFCSPHIGHO2_12_FULL_42_9]
MATTPIDPSVCERMNQFMGPNGGFGNAASTTHQYGRIAALAIDRARSQIATVTGASPQNLIFTSGATEANNLAILGAARFYRNQGRHLITMSVEHKSVLDSFHQLEKEGFTVTYVRPEPDGLLDLNKLEAALTSTTILGSIMHVNNEIGVIQDIAAIGSILRKRGVVFHVDAAQSIGKLPINLAELPIDLMSLSAHKNYGPKGIGVLYVNNKPRIRLQPQSFGGGHELGLRSGTLPTHQIVGMGEAVWLAEQNREYEQTRLLNLRHKLWEGIKLIPGIKLNGHPTHRVAGNLNIMFTDIEGGALLSALNGLAISSTSACMAASNQPSYVLQELGLNNSQASSSIRLSLGRYTTEEQIDRTIGIILSGLKF